VGEEDDTSVADFVMDQSDRGPEELAHNLLLQQEARQVLMAALNARERRVLEMRFGLGDGHIYSLDIIGQRLGLTRERVRQIETRALQKLRASQASQRLREYLPA
jgi:RNA polymerase sigma factor (sigma-70 family)